MGHEERNVKRSAYGFPVIQAYDQGDHLAQARRVVRPSSVFRGSIASPGILSLLPPP